MGFDFTSLLDPLGLFVDNSTPASVDRYPGESKLSKQQQQLMDSFLSYLMPYASGSTKLPDYTGNRVAELSTTERNAMGNLSEQDPLNILNRYSLSNFLSGQYGSSPYLESFYKTNVEQPMLQTWTEKMMPNTRGSYAKKGLLYGSGREMADLNDRGMVFDTLAKNRSSLLEDMWKTNQTNMLQASQLTNADASNQLARLQTLFNMGGTERGIEQKKSDTAYEAWLRNQPGTRPTDALISQMLGLNTMYEPTSVVNPASADSTGSMLAGAAAAAAAAA